MDVLLWPYHSRLLIEWALDWFVTSFALVSLHSSPNLSVTPLMTLPSSLSSHFSPWSTQTLHHSLPLSHSWWCLSSCQCLCFSHNKPWSTTSGSSFWQQVLAHIWKDSKNQPLFPPFVEPSHFFSSPCCQSAIALTPHHVRIQKILITRFERKRSKALQELTIWAVLGTELSLSAKFTCQVRSIITEMPVHMDRILSWSRTKLKELISVFTHFHLRLGCRSSVPDLAFQDAIAASQTAKQAVVYFCKPRVMRYSSPQAGCKRQNLSLLPLNNLNFAAANCHLPSLINPPEWQVHLASSVSHSLGKEDACCVGTGRRRRRPRTNLLTWHSIQL